jgi:hypothetical protein
LARVTSTVRRFMRSAAWRNQVAGSIIHVEVERSTPDSRRAKARKVLDDAEVLHDAGLLVEAQSKRESGRALLAREKKTARLPPARRSWWHAHIHVACSSGFWAIDDVNAAWAYAASRTIRWGAVVAVDKDGADVPGLLVGCRSAQKVHADMRRPARGVRGVVDELTKYITKPMSLGRLSVGEVAELVQGISGRRLLRCTGALRGLKLDEAKKPTTEKEGAAGDGVVAPIGYVVDDTALLGGVRGVYLSDVDTYGRSRVDGVAPEFQDCVAVYRDDDEAQEFRRAAAERTWALHQAGRMQGIDEDALPIS